MTDSNEYTENIAKRASAAKREIRTLKTSTKNDLLKALADEILKKKETIMRENEKDIKAAREKNLSPTLIDRLLLNEKRIESLATSVLEIAALPDPIGEVVRGVHLPNGIELVSKRVPLGVVLVIYESRPNVTIDVGALSFKSGNIAILRGGSEAIYSNIALVTIFRNILKSKGINEDAVIFVDQTDRSHIVSLLSKSQDIDIVVPRGGEGLIQFVTENSKIPVIKHDKGVCNIFVDASADFEKTVQILLNAKTQRPGVCNAVENVCIHKDFPQKKELLESLKAKNVDLLLDEPLLSIFPDARLATNEDYALEFLDLRLSFKTVSGIEEAISFIEKYSSGHSEAILSEDHKNIEKFLSQLDSAALFVNCSTRFHDGGEFGFGAEVGISTGKLHVRGPMGLVHLTTTKTIMRGDGQVRG
ncbi:MAG TPA: glutamate-5-semialdehyde dehydrogenase [Leptospiraceae bacterium]|nr:glutamate-5-semialdehyde dehydrogenase [Leptospiraceae bacterium]